MKIRCNECWNMVEPIIKEGGPDWFDSYFCPNCENGKGREIARKSNKDGRFVWWNGHQFERSVEPK